MGYNAAGRSQRAQELMVADRSSVRCSSAYSPDSVVRTDWGNSVVAAAAEVRERVLESHRPSLLVVGDPRRDMNQRVGRRGASIGASLGVGVEAEGRRRTCRGVKGRLEVGVGCGVGCMGLEEGDGGCVRCTQVKGDDDLQMVLQRMGRPLQSRLSKFCLACCEENQAWSRVLSMVFRSSHPAPFAVPCAPPTIWS